MKRHLAALLAGLFSLGLHACNGLSGHAPVSRSVIRQMERQNISRDQFDQRLNQARTDNLRSLPKGRSITLPFLLRSNTPCITAQATGGQEIPMMLDTGAGRMVISARTAAKLKMPVVNSSEVQSTMLGVVGKEQGRVGILSPLKLGTWTLPAYPCFVRTYENIVPGMDFPENILGFDLAENYCSYLTIDYPRRTATFAFNQTFRLTPSKNSSSTPFSIKNGVPYIEIQAGKVRWKSIIDTGSFNGVEINQDIARKLSVQDEGRPVEGMILIAVGGTVTSDHANIRTVTLPEIKFCGGKYPQAEVDISPGVPRVGSHFLKDYRVTFDFDRNRVWLEW